MSTRAIKFLSQKGIYFEVKEYKHEEKGARFASEAMDFPLERTIKTLVVDLGQKGYILVLMPGEKNIDLKRLAKAFSVKRAAMADTSTAERLTGYLVGGISPFGTKQNLPVFMEAGLLEFDKVDRNALLGTGSAISSRQDCHALRARNDDVKKIRFVGWKAA